MPLSITRGLAICIALAFNFSQVASNREVLIGDAKSQPESLTVAPGGVLIVGSASSPFVYRVRPGSTTAEKFIDVSTTEGPGTFFLGMLADASTDTLWTCQLTPVPNTTPPARHTALRSFDLTTGAPKIRWNLPGDTNVCNDFTIGPDKPFILSIPFPAESSGLPPAPPPRISTSNTPRSEASMASPFSMAFCT